MDSDIFFAPYLRKLKAFFVLKTNNTAFCKPQLQFSENKWKFFVLIPNFYLYLHMFFTNIKNEKGYRYRCP